MLLSQQANLQRLDERRAVVRVSGNWIAMVQGRLPLLEGAMTKALGSPRQVTLEASEQRDGAPVAAPLPAPASAEPRVLIATEQPGSLTVEPPVSPGSEAQTSRTTATSRQPEAASTPPIEEAPGQATTSKDLRTMGGISSGKLDAKTKLFADFFNGEVVAGEDQPG
jgi:DNA polymerase-3 subunit gamma/tau